MKSRQSISSSEYFPITTFPIFVTKVSEMDHSKQTEISQKSRPKKNQCLKNKLILVTLIAFGM